ncbi:hypothetical protein MMC25_007660 [Agyrium rufum]|nr:hypothetical protein [Agyrium rufum]
MPRKSTASTADVPGAESTEANGAGATSDGAVAAAMEVRTPVTSKSKEGKSDKGEKSGGGGGDDGVSIDVRLNSSQAEQNINMLRLCIMGIRNSRIGILRSQLMGKADARLNGQDLSLPRTMVQRLAKGVLPPNTQVQKDAITAMSKGATLFISYLASNANDHTTQTSRRTISPEDVFLAIRDTEFEAFLPRLQAELGRYNEVQTGKRNEYRKKVKEGTLGVGSKIAEQLGAKGTDRVKSRKNDGEDGPEDGEGGQEMEMEIEMNGEGLEQEGERSAKRARLSGVNGDDSDMFNADMSMDRSGISSSSVARRGLPNGKLNLPRNANNIDGEEADHEEQGMGSEAGDTVTESEDEVGDGEDDDDDDVDRVGNIPGEDVDSESASGSEMGSDGDGGGGDGNSDMDHDG